jgi:hypothetical protein
LLASFWGVQATRGIDPSHGSQWAGRANTCSKFTLPAAHAEEHPAPEHFRRDHVDPPTQVIGGVNG